jgi:hypothetical protein
MEFMERNFGAPDSAYDLDESGEIYADTQSARITWVLYSFLIVLPLVPGSYVRLYSIVLALLFLFQALARRHWELPTNGAAIVFLVSQTYAFVFHGFEGESFLNIAVTTVSFLAIYLSLSKAVERLGVQQVEKRVYDVLIWATLIMFPLSTLLTLVHYPTAPSAYFWQADNATGNRMLLMRGNSAEEGSRAASGFGHSDVIWVAGFFLALNEKVRRNIQVLGRRWIRHILILLAGCAILILSGGRIALILMLEAFLVFLHYRKLLNIRIFALINLGLMAFYLLLCFSLPASLAVQAIIYRVQGSLPAIRLGQSEDSSSSLLSNREELNVQLVNESRRHPFVGEGHGAPILSYGIDKYGSVASGSEDRALSTESGLRLVVAYGYPYFILQIMFMAWPMWKAVRNRSEDPGMACAVSGMVLLTFVSEGAFENWYSVTLLLGIMTVLYCVDQEPSDMESSREMSKLNASYDLA